MEQYHAQLKRRRVLLLCLSALLLGLLCLALLAATLRAEFMADNSLAGFTAGYSTSILLVLALAMLRAATLDHRALRSEEALRKRYIAEHDERARMIREKIGGLGLDVSLGLIALSSAITAYWQPVISATLIAAAFLTAMVKLSLKLYYHKRY